MGRSVPVTRGDAHDGPYADEHEQIRELFEVPPNRQWFSLWRGDEDGGEDEDDDEEEEEDQEEWDRNRCRTLMGQGIRVRTWFKGKIHQGGNSRRRVFHFKLCCSSLSWDKFVNYRTYKKMYQVEYKICTVWYNLITMYLDCRRSSHVHIAVLPFLYFKRQVYNFGKLDVNVSYLRFLKDPILYCLCAYVRIRQ